MIHVKFLLASLALSGLLLLQPASAQGGRGFDFSARVGATLSPVAELTASDAVAGNALGMAVGISGNTIVVGGDCNRVSGNSQCNRQNLGVVYVYQKSGDQWANMVQTAELTPSDGFAGDEFGTALAISGNTVVVGANSGKVYVFVEPASGWTNMNETAQLLSTSSDSIYFGAALAIDKGTIVVGQANASVRGVQEGAAYVYVKPPTGWTNTSTFKAQLTASDGALYAAFGIGVSVNGDTIAVGAPSAHGGGEVYVFTKPATGWANMTETAKLTKSHLGSDDEFGLAVSVSGNTVVAGAPRAAGDHGAGAVEVFVMPAQGWVNATETAELEAPYTSYFGFSVAIAGPKIAVGTFSSSNLVYLYAKPQSGWGSTTKPSAEFAAGDGLSYFGFWVGVTGNTVVAGAPYETVNGQAYEGSAYIFND